MKKLLLLLMILSLVATLHAQMPAGGMGNGKMPTAPAIGRVYGKVVDASGKGIRDAYVVVLQNRMDTVTHKMKEVLLKGVSTQANGEFNLENLPLFPPLKLTITSVGYEALTQTVAFEMKKPAAGAATTAPKTGQMPDMSALAGQFEKDLGDIALKTDNKQLEQVTVTATSRMKVDIDKKVFNVGQNIVSAGGTAVDVMKNVPSVNVDIDGNVTLRNASPQLYIDGRPTTLTLDQIPADAIESVEVITNPSAKYDASGGNAGILNIVLKKNKKSGYNGSINAGVDKRGGINGGASINVRQNKFNVSLAGFTNQMKNHGTSTTNIRSLLTSPNTLVDQNTTTRNNNQFIFGKAGVDYFATNRTTISLGVIRVHGEFKPRDMLRTDSSYDGGSYLSYSERSTETHRQFNAYGVQGGFKYSFPKKGEELTADFNIFSGKNENTYNYNTNTYVSNGGLQKGNIQQQINGNGTNQFSTFQADYVKPLSATAKLETGARVQLRKLTNGQANYYLNSSTGQFEQISSSASNYKNNEGIYAAYVSFSNSIKNFGYQIGLRAERSDYEGELTDSKQKFSNNYPISLFPSIFLSQKLGGSQELQFSATRRVNRPFFMQLIPFIDSTDQTNWSQGNAALKPEFTNSLEASYSKTYGGNNTFLASVYYKYTTNLISKYLDTITVGSTKHPVTTYVNADYSRSIGMELTAQNTFTSWWDINANVNIYNSKINTSNVSGATTQDPMWSWFGKINSNFKLPKKFKLQLSGTYQSKTNLPVNTNSNGGPGNGPPMGGSQSATQGYIKNNWGADAALAKSFLKNDAATITFNVSDIFGTRRYDQYSVSEYYVLNSHRLNDVPMFRLNFSWRFGQMDMSLFKRKNTKGDSEGMQGAMQMQ